MHRAPNPSAPAWPAWARFALALLLGVAMGVWCIAEVWPFFADDAFISLRYADRLLAGQGLTWTDGERVEGYSNLAWVLLCASFGAGLGTATAARVLGLLGMGTALALFAWRFRHSPAAGIGVLLPATLAFAPWAIGGLELPLLVLCATGGLLAYERAFAAASPAPALVRSGICFAVAALTRPDAPLLPAVLAITWFLCAWPRRREGARPLFEVAAFSLPVGVAMVGQLAFRVAYYGDWLANTSRVKVGDGAGLPAEGLAYVGDAVVVMGGLWVLAALGAASARWQRAGPGFVAALVAATLAWVAYLIAIGGDFFPAFRLVVPLLPVLALLAGIGLERLANGGGRRALAASLLVIGATVACRLQARHHPEKARVAAEVWEFDGLAIGGLLREAFASTSPLVAVDAAGAVPWASRLPSLDMLGLCDAAIARDPLRAPARTSFERAHRRGSADYLLARAPDVFLFGCAPGDLIPLDPAGRALVDDARFVADYRCVFFEVPAAIRRAGGSTPLFAPLWLRVHGRCGVQVRDDGVHIPAILFGSAPMVPGFRPEPPEDPPARAVWDRTVAQLLPWLSLSSVVVVAEGAPWLEVRKAGELRVPALHLPPGDWTLEAEPAAGTLELRDAADAPLPRVGGRWRVASAADAVDVVWVLAAAPAPWRLRRVTCRPR
ncbi:MAG TPA: hypothetical protein VFZ65_07845 [Planctomycetota bacterium]|nr:hypothetical protein [Planctomycetota bacterium]